MMLDPLHQLLKGIMVHLRGWLVQEVGAHIKANRRQGGRKSHVATSNATTRLDERFRRVNQFSGLKVFKNYSAITQWTGVEDKSLLRQIIPVFAPLLLPKSKYVLSLARAIVEFCILSTYVSHDEETLRYMEHALFRINKFKPAVGHHRLDGHFNFPKWHVQCHYPEYIRQYGAADNFDTEHSEANHKFHVKDFYDRTNKRETYLEQLIGHSIRRLNAIATEDIRSFEDSNKHTNVHKDKEPLETNTLPTGCLKLDLIDGLPRVEEKCKIRSYGLNPSEWCTALSLATYANIPDLLPALAVFVRQQREESSGVIQNHSAGDRLERDFTWVLDMPVQVHGALRCWSPDGKDSTNLERLTPHMARCKPGWQGGLYWRRDWVWVQETPGQESSSNVMNGRLPGQLKIIISVLDQEHVCKRRSRVYSGALIEVLRLRKGGEVHEVHGMIEVERWPKPIQDRQRRSLGNTRIYPMSTILRSAHLVPATLDGDDIFFINNYIDWDTFNSLYDPDFEVNGTRAALRFATLNK